MTDPRPCPACAGPKRRLHYVCTTCWPQLPGPARRALNRRDPGAVRRLCDLLEQLRNEVPLAEVVITP